MAEMAVIFKIRRENTYFVFTKPQYKNKETLNMVKKKKSANRSKIIHS